jgi:WD40 repeat protein/nucleoside phosphorylase
MARVMASPPVAHFVAEPAPQAHPRAVPRGGERAVDVLILTALQDELEAVLALGDGGRAGWLERQDQKDFRCYRRAFPNGRGGTLTVAAAWSGEMGDRTAAMRAQQLVEELNPACLAMCGICAGCRGKVSLGDVIVAEQLYAYDEGKIIAGAGAKAEMLHSLRTFDLQATWKMDAAYLARELDLSALSRARPPSKEAQRRWLLRALLAHESEGGPSPAAHPERKGACPGWTERLKEAVKDGLVAMKGASLRLTDAGREHVEEDGLLHPDGPPADPPLRIHVGAIGTGTAVQEDPELFARLRRLVRSTLGVEMEGVAIGDVAERHGKRAIVIKAVSDHADHDKDDSFREFACRASAEVLLAFLLKRVEPAPAPDDGPGEDDDGEPDPEDPRGDRRMLGDRRDGFLARVERVAAVREAGDALIVRHRAPPPFAGVLEVAVRDGALVDVRVVGALEQPVTEALLAQYLDEVERRYRRENPSVSSTLVHGGPQASLELARSALRKGVVLKSFASYQGIIDFRGYLAKQTSRLEVDPVYPPWLYVDQPARWSLAGGREEQATEHALATLSELLEAPHARFALVLGDFGAGKTFLLHELARRMARDEHRVVPVLVEMSRLEKQRSLKALLAQHFALADEGRIDLDAFQYMLAAGRIALLFDGFDELALRLTYDRALEHFETVMAAAGGNAKVVLTSRTQHFLTDHQVRRALAERAEQVPGYRLIQLDRFGEKQIRRFLGNLIKQPEEAEERYRLLDEVKDLLGLSENPRMLGFIARIAPDKLREAKAQSGEITAAKLYEILIGQWLDFEWDRVNPRGAERGLTRAKIAELVSKLAGLFWERNAKTLPLGDFTHLLVAEDIEPAVVEHMIGSGSLLVRDAEGRFSFVHRSVMEWLVADAAAREVRDKGDAAALGADEMSELMADFFIGLAAREQAERWAHDKGRQAAEGAAKKNAARVVKRIEVIAGPPRAGEIDVPVTLDLAGQDLRGQDWSRVDWRGANLDGADLRSATLLGARLGGASLVGAKLGRANLQWADLAGADLAGADLSFARLMGVDLRGAAHLEAASLRGAMLVGAEGVGVEGLEAVGAAPPVPGEAAPMWAPGSGCNAVAWSPSGDLVASGHADGSIRLWDAESGKAIRTMHGHSGPVQSVAFSPDGNSLASGSHDKTVRLWEVATVRALRAFEGHQGAVNSVAFSPDGHTLASGSHDNTVRLWDVATARVLRAFDGHDGAVRSVAFSPDGHTLASGSSDKTVRLWDVATARVLRAFEGHTHWINSVAFSPDGHALASGSSDNRVRLWDVDTATALRAFEGHLGAVWSVAFSPDGHTLASGSSDNRVHLWDVATAAATALRVFNGHNDAVQSLAFSPDGHTLVSGSSDNRVRLWDAATARALRAFEGNVKSITSVAFSPDGHTLASSSLDRTGCLWDVATARALRTFEEHPSLAVSVAFSPDGHTIASGSLDHLVRLLDVATARPLRVFEGHTNWVTTVAFSPDGGTLASGSFDKMVRLWDVATARPLRAFEGHSNWVNSVAFSPDGHTLASGSDDKTARLWDVATARAPRAYEGHNGAVSSVAFSPDGHSIASGSYDKTVRLWDVATVRTLRVFEGPMSAVMSVAFSPDGNALAAGSADSSVCLWSVATACGLRAFEGHKGAVQNVAFSPDGRTLASGSSDGTIRLWDVATARCLAILLPTPEGWAAFTPDGRYKIGGDVAGSFWHVIGLCRFEPGELDPYLPHLRVADDAPLLALPPRAPG